MFSEKSFKNLENRKIWRRIKVLDKLTVHGASGKMSLKGFNKNWSNFHLEYESL